MGEVASARCRSVDVERQKGGSSLLSGHINYLVFTRNLFRFSVLAFLPFSMSCPSFGCVVVYAVVDVPY